MMKTKTKDQQIFQLNINYFGSEIQGANSTNLKVRMVHKKQYIFWDVNAEGPKIWGTGGHPIFPTLGPALDS